MKIFKQEQLNQHPILNQIPKLVWDKEFKWGFDDSEVEQLHDKQFNQVRREHLPEGDMQAFIVLLAYYPLFTQQCINFARDTLKLSEKGIFVGIAVMGRVTTLQAMFTQSPSSEWLAQVTDNFAYTFSLVAGCGQLPILTFFKEKFPRHYAHNVEKGVAIFRAAQYNQLPALQMMIDQSPVDKKEIVKSFSGYSLNDVAREGSLDALKLIHKLDPEEFAQLLAETYSLLATAASAGQLETCKWIKGQVSQTTFHAMIEYNTFKAYGLTPFKYRPLHDAAINGHLSTCKWLKEQVSVKKFIEMMKFDMHSILRDVVYNSQPEVFEWFNEAVPAIVKDFLKDNACDVELMGKYRRMLQPAAQAKDLLLDGKTSFFKSKRMPKEELTGYNMQSSSSDKQSTPAFRFGSYSVKD